MDSILNSVKCILGIADGYEAFDNELILYINSALASLRQLGVGNQNGFSIASELETWNDFLGDEYKPFLENAKVYVGLKVRMIFDPPQSSAVIDAMNGSIKECEWRIYQTIDHLTKGGTTSE